jgi:PKD repeat protein
MKKILCFIGIIALCFSAHAVAQPIPPNAGEIYQLVGEWGAFGSADGQFWNPTGIAVDATGNVYVADRDNHRIQKFTAAGEYINKWGWYGPLDGQMRFPSAVAVDNSSDVYVTDTENYRVQKFSSDGAFIAKWGTEVVPRAGSCDCSNRIPGVNLLFPQAIYVDISDSLNSLYLMDDCNIQKIDSAPSFIKDWNHTDITPCVDEGDFGGHPYHLSMAIASEGNVYLIGHELDFEDFHLIYEYTSDGAFIRKWGSGEEGGNNPSIGEFLDLSGIAVDSSNNVYAVDRDYLDSKIRVLKFTFDGQFLTQWAFNRGDINVTEVINTGIAIDSTGNVYILNGNRVQKFAIAPPVTTTTTTPTTTTTSVPGTTTTTTVRPTGTKPNASFFVKPSTARVSVTFTFNASGSTDKEDLSEDLVVRWDWENDGVWDTDYSPDKIATHQYSTAGIYTINLEVKDTQGLTDTTTRRIIVWAEPRLCAASYLLGKNNPRLGALRKFRDNVLAESLVGIKMVELYYKNGAKIIGVLEESPLLKKSAKAVLERLIP